MGLFRLLLALAVVAAHAGPIGGVEWLTGTGGPRAVQTFYVVSGFYMALVLNEKYVGPGSYATFVKSRLLRLLPMYFAVLLATLLVAFALHAVLGRTLAPLAAWREHGAAMPWSHWLALQAPNATLLGQDVVSFLAVDPATHTVHATANFHAEPLPAWRFLWVPQAWTISLELWFYALAPWLVRRRPAVLVAVVLASFALRVYLMRAHELYHDPWTYRFFPTELALFLTGALAWHAYRALRDRGWLAPALGWLATAALLVGVGTFQFLGSFVWEGRYGVPGLLLVVAPLLPFAFHATKDVRVDRALGELSYPVYLVHYLFVFAVDALDVAWLHAHRGAAVAGASVLAAAGLWFGVGRPFELRRQRLRG
jgi:peptidoglycan/LPS O-acetylase OafA/YrhL